MRGRCPPRSATHGIWRCVTASGGGFNWSTQQRATARRRSTGACRGGHLDANGWVRWLLKPITDFWFSEQVREPLFRLERAWRKSCAGHPMSTYGLPVTKACPHLYNTGQKMPKKR
ncbi:protein of unknown function [Burkholderia multivorans]